MRNGFLLLALFAAPTLAQAQVDPPLACPAIIDSCDIRADWRDDPVPENDLQCGIPWGEMHLQCVYCQGLSRQVTANHRAEQELLTGRIAELELALQKASGKLAATARRNRSLRRVRKRIG
jgi:hypothetical protein